MWSLKLVLYVSFLSKQYFPKSLSSSLTMTLKFNLTCHDNAIEFKINLSAYKEVCVLKWLINHVSHF